MPSLTNFIAIAAIASGMASASFGPPWSQCWTRLASEKVDVVPTSWRTSWTSCTVTQTSTVTTRVALAKTKSTITVTHTANTTTIEKASTIATPTGFIPIQSSLPNSNYTGAEGSLNATNPNSVNATNPVERDVDEFDLVARAAKPLIHGHSFPKKVECCSWKHHPCQTKTTTITSTTTSGPTSSKVKTVTVTTTPSTTVFTTPTYAACAPDNFADIVNGHKINDIKGGLLRVDELAVDSLYDCCVAAINDPNDGTFFLANENADGTYECYIGNNDGTCPNPATNAAIAITAPGGPNLPPAVIGNGPCGVVNGADTAATA